MIVDGFNAALRACAAGYARLFEPLQPVAGLALVSALVGLGMLWVVGKTSDQEAITKAKKRMQAYLLEMRLYRDEPGLLFRAQGNLVLQNLRYVAHMLRPALVLTLPMVVLYGHFDAVYGRRPLRAGESALLTVETDLPGGSLSLAGSHPFAVDSASVASAVGREVVWRVRAEAEGRGALTVKTPHGTVSKSAVAGGGHSYVSASRAGAWWQRLLLSPGEAGFERNGVTEIRIAYPARRIGVGAWQTHWAVWFLGISIVTALLFRNRLGVTI